jgi:class 3 adenylate cyclase
MSNCAVCGAALPAAARFCPACGAAVEAIPPGEERKLATVLFADLVGSTELGEQDPERTRALLDRFYDAMAEEITDAGGTVEKFAGDAVMAAFGAPAAHEDHAERALHAALSMHRRLGELFGDRLQLRIGVNTGEVVVGRPREGSSFVTGDAVNVAARLEQAAGVGETLVGERTAAAARGAFEFGDLQRIDAKGKRTPVECRRLVRALSLMRPRGVGGLHRTFVGRERELDVLQALYHRVVEQREPHLVTIMGDAGVGKTRLVRELWDWLGTCTPEPTRRTGRSLPYGHGITYWPLGEVLKEHFEILESDPPEAVRRKLAGRDILALTLGLEVAPDLHPLAARDRLHDGWVDFLSELAGERPVVMLIEDLHWADDELLDLLERLGRDVHCPLLVLATARPELLDRRPTWGGGRRNASLLWLEPLTSEASTRLLDELVAAEFPAHVRDLIVERAEGNPFFVEELLGTLIDRGVVARANGGWSIGELPRDFEVPDSVHAVLAARIDLLRPPEKAALQAAAVIGRIFWTGPVCELIEGDDPDFGVLEERDFIRRRAGSAMAGEREYSIKHALTREVAYATLPKAKRARMHAAFADWLERISDQRDDLAPLLAHHYAEAVRPEDADLAWDHDDSDFERLKKRAVAWLTRSGDLAVGRYEIDEGIALLERAVALENEQPAQSAIWRAIGRANALKFDGEAFWTAMQRSLDVCADRATCADSYAEMALQTATRSGMWRKRPAHDLVDGWIERALELAEPESAARAKALVAQCVWRGDEGAEAAVEASALAERLGNIELRVEALGARAIADWRRGDYAAALTWAQRRLDLVGELTNPDDVAGVYELAVAPCGAMTRFREARRLAGEHDRVVERLSVHHQLHGVAVVLEVEELIADWDRIRELTPRLEERVEANLDTPCIRNARSLLIAALAAHHADAGSGAVRLERRADEVALEGYEDTLAAPRVRLALARRDLDAVARLLPPFDASRGIWYAMASEAARLDALAALRDRETLENEAPSLLRRKTYLEPFALRALGIARADEELVERGRERFRALKLAWHADQTDELLKLQA